MSRLYLRDINLYNTISLLDLETHRTINPNLDVVVINSYSNIIIGKLEKVIHRYPNGEVWRDLIVYDYTNKSYLFDSEIKSLAAMVWAGDN